MKYYPLIILFRKDRPSRGGGVLIAINNKISCQITSSPTNLELMCVRLLISNPITICVTYIPPNSPKVYCDDLFNFLLNRQAASDKLIILDDFNFPDIDWDTLSGHSPNLNQFCDMIFQANSLMGPPTFMVTSFLPIWKTIFISYKFFPITCCYQTITA